MLPIWDCAFFGNGTGFRGGPYCSRTGQQKLSDRLKAPLGDKGGGWLQK